MARDHGGRHGPSPGAQKRWHRSRPLPRLCLRHGPRPDRHAPLQRGGHPTATGERRSLLESVLMQISLAWLRDYVDVPQDVDLLAERLTRSGTEVERIEVRSPGFEGVIVAEVTGLRPHPGGGSNRLATVRTGNGAVEVVTGAPNLKVGDRVPYAPVGARLGD